MNEIMVKYDKILLVYEPFEGDVCFENTLINARVPENSLYLALDFIAQISMKVHIFYDSDKYNIDFFYNLIEFRLE